jgi:hypothetical protein
MTQKEFIKVLDNKRYSYEIVGDKIVITHKGIVILIGLPSLPSGVEFLNMGIVYLDLLREIPPNVIFSNSSVYLKSLIGGFFDDWNGNIEGISSGLLNKMIADGLFDRR